MRFKIISPKSLKETKSVSNTGKPNTPLSDKSSSKVSKPKLKVVDSRFVNLFREANQLTKFNKGRELASILSKLKKLNNPNINNLISNFFSELNNHLSLKKRLALSKGELTKEELKNRIGVINKNIEFSISSNLSSFKKILDEKLSNKPKKKVARINLPKNMKDINYYSKISKISPKIKSRILSLYNQEENRGLRERFNLILQVCEGTHKTNASTLVIEKDIQKIIASQKTKNPFTVFYHHIKKLL